MGRLKKRLDEKAVSITVSMKPQHTAYIEEIKLKTKEDRSELIQRLVTEERNRLNNTLIS